MTLYYVDVETFETADVCDILEISEGTEDDT